MFHMCKLGITIILLFCLAEVRGYAQPGKTVHAKAGSVEGTVSRSRLRREFYSWLSIPYAKPPVGRLRFASPQPLEKWEGVLQARHYGPRCAQYDGFQELYFGREDCLTLNIFAPKDVIDDAKERLPVMVFIHGGGYMSGASRDFAPVYFMDENVVFVTLNYRLGSFGFLNTNDGTVRGNMGLKDQALALRWVQENIEYFGGDKYQVTIFGESAGAMSVNLHMMSPMSKGLFHKGISQSGVAISHFSLNKDPGLQAGIFVDALNCPLEPAAKMLECLRGKDPYEILEFHGKHNFWFQPESRFKESIFVPTVEVVQDEETFLGSAPDTLIKEGRVESIPWMTGVNSADGLIWMLPFLTNSTFRRQLNSKWDQYAASELFLTPEERRGTEAIRKFYFREATDISSLGALPEYLKLQTDRWFNIPFYKAVNEHGTRAPTYAYYYTKIGPSICDIFLNMNRRAPRLLGLVASRLQDWIRSDFLRTPRQRIGACHSDELLMMGPIIPLLLNVQPGTPDFEFSKDLVKLWAEFATNGTELAFRDTIFPQFKPGEDPQYFELNENPKLVQLHLKERVDFWDDISNKIS